jgi:hypothetical protein
LRGARTTDGCFLSVQGFAPGSWSQVRPSPRAIFLLPCLLSRLSRLFANPPERLPSDARGREARLWASTCSPRSLRRAFPLSAGISCPRPSAPWRRSIYGRRRWGGSDLASRVPKAAAPTMSRTQARGEMARYLKQVALTTTAARRPRRVAWWKTKSLT